MGLSYVVMTSRVSEHNGSLFRRSVRNTDFSGLPHWCVHYSFSRYVLYTSLSSLYRVSIVLRRSTASRLSLRSCVKRIKTSRFCAQSAYPGYAKSVFGAKRGNVNNAPSSLSRAPLSRRRHVGIGSASSRCAVPRWPIQAQRAVSVFCKSNLVSVR